MWTDFRKDCMITKYNFLAKHYNLEDFMRAAGHIIRATYAFHAAILYPCLVSMDESLLESRHC